MGVNMVCVCVGGRGLGGRQGQNELCTQKWGHEVPPTSAFCLRGWAWSLIEATLTASVKGLAEL